MARQAAGAPLPLRLVQPVAGRRLAAVGTVQSKPTLQLHNPCHQRRVRGQQCRNGFLLRGILNLQTRNDLLRHFGSAGSLGVILPEGDQSRCHEQVTHATNPVSSVFLLPHTWVVTINLL